jgi:hypothetical protein
VKNGRHRLLVVDIDGTIIGTSRAISVENREAVKRAGEAGIAVAVSTGRSLRSALRVLEQLSLDSHHIFFDGAYAGRPDLSEELYSQPLAPELVRRMVEFCHEHGIDLELFSPGRYYAERETWSTEAHCKFFGVDATMRDFTGLWEQERIIKGGLVTVDAAEEALVERFRQHFGDMVHFSAARTPAYPGVTFNNVLAVGVSKGRALEALAYHLGISTAEVMAVGDGSNDIPLLKTAGLSIAMGNAPDEVKAVADHVTLDVERHGLAEAIYKYLL